jgi:CRP-like cAMP-binding protein
MPKSVQFKANSIVYFKGDPNENIFILKSGKVVLKYNDIETGQELHELIQMGEFYGVKSALGKYPKEETALVLQESEMLVFTVPEFEQVAMKNTRIIMKMLKVFSNQLRRIHKQVQNLLSTGGEHAAVEPELGLFRIGEYYLKRKQYKQALYVFRRYLTFYPSGKFSSQATINIDLCERAIQGQPVRPVFTSDTRFRNLPAPPHPLPVPRPNPPPLPHPPRERGENCRTLPRISTTP